MKFIGNPKYSEGNLHASADQGKDGWPSVVLKAAYKKCPAPSAQEYKDLAMEAYGNHTDANIADVKRFFGERRLQEFAKKEAALKRKVSPPVPGMVTNVEKFVLSCAAKNLGDGRMTKVNLKFLLGLVGYSANGPKPELIYRMFEAQAKLAEYAEIESPATAAEEEEEEEDPIGDDEVEEEDSEDEHECDVCHDGTIKPGNALLVCSTCGSARHEGCGSPYSFEDGVWQCVPCTNAAGTSGTDFIPGRRAPQDPPAC